VIDDDNSIISIECQSNVTRKTNLRCCSQIEMIESIAAPNGAATIVVHHRGTDVLG
jgi:hypothetical protein